ncbi:MAG: hypothetical protein H0T46_17300 [Deltaproteobacteria bacterium]|nr:hypothetical protein [Deltaproteobacteria bacterium]
MSPIALVLGAASLFLAVVHVLGGGRAVARPMLAADFDVVARDTMHVVWHGVSAQLALAGLGLIATGLAPSASTEPLVRAVATLYLAYAGLFLWIAIASRRRRALVELGQWMAFLPLGVAGWLATL